MDLSSSANVAIAFLRSSSHTSCSTVAKDSKSLHERETLVRDLDCLSTSLSINDISIPLPTHWCLVHHHKSSLHSISSRKFFQRALRSEVLYPAGLQMIITHTDTHNYDLELRCAFPGVCLDLTKISLFVLGVASANLEFPLSFETGWHEGWRENPVRCLGLRERHFWLLAG